MTLKLDFNNINVQRQALSSRSSYQQQTDMSRTTFFTKDLK